MAVTMKSNSFKDFRTHNITIPSSLSKSMISLHPKSTKILVIETESEAIVPKWMKEVEKTTNVKPPTRKLLVGVNISGEGKLTMCVGACCLTASLNNLSNSVLKALKSFYSNSKTVFVLAKQSDQNIIRGYALIMEKSVGLKEIVVRTFKRTDLIPFECDLLTLAKTCMERDEAELIWSEIQKKKGKETEVKDACLKAFLCFKVSWQWDHYKKKKKQQQQKRKGV